MARSIAPLLDVVVLVSTGVGLVLAFGASRPDEPIASRPRVLAHPLVQWALVWILLYANQVAFGAHVLATHGGDVGFLTRHLPLPGWFAIARDDVCVRWLAAHAGDGRWLAPSILRVQAFLELPFTLYAYLAVARFFGRDVERALVRPAPLFAASISFSVTFSLVEVALANPWTRDDLVLRALAAVTVPFWVRATSRVADAPGEARPRGAFAWLVALVGAASVAVALLVAYDTFLLYNLAHLRAHLPTVGVTWPLAILAGWLAPRLGGERPGTSLDAHLAATLGGFARVFFVPSLAIRYAGDRTSALLAGLVVVLAGVALGLVELARRRALGGAALALVAGASVGALSVHVVLQTAVAGGELLLAVLAVAFLAPLVVTARLVDLALRP